MSIRFLEYNIYHKQELINQLENPEKIVKKSQDHESKISRIKTGSNDFGFASG